MTDEQLQQQEIGERLAKLRAKFPHFSEESLRRCISTKAIQLAIEEPKPGPTRPVM